MVIMESAMPRGLFPGTIWSSMDYKGPSMRSHRGCHRLFHTLDWQICLLAGLGPFFNGYLDACESGVTTPAAEVVA